MIHFSKDQKFPQSLLSVIHGEHQLFQLKLNTGIVHFGLSQSSQTYLLRICRINLVKDHFICVQPMATNIGLMVSVVK